MKKIKSYLLWFFLLEKRLFRKVGFILVLASVPLLVLVISLISSRAEGAIEVVLSPRSRATRSSRRSRTNCSRTARLYLSARSGRGTKR